MKAGCHRRAVYFCLAQLSPEAIWLRAGGERKPVFSKRQKDAVADADYFVDDERRLGTREHLEAVANTAKAARKQIHECRESQHLAPCTYTLACVEFYT